MPDSTQSVDWNRNAPILAPDGQMHAVPLGVLPQALADPALKRAIPMAGEDGVHHWIPEDQVHAAVAAGNRISWPSQEIPKWFGFTAGNMASNAWSGAKGLATGTYDLGKDLVNNPNWFEGSGSTYNKFIGQPAEAQVVKAGQALNSGQPVAAAGHTLASAVPLVGPWAAGLGEQVGRGDVGGAASQAIGTLGAGKLATSAPAILDRAIPSTARSGAGLTALTDSPSAAYAQHPVLTPKADATANSIEQQLAVTGERPPAIIQNHLGNMQLRNTPPMQGFTPSAPLTMWEARTMLKRVNDVIDASKGFSADTGSKTMVNGLKRFAGALDDDISSAADQGGFGKQYDGLRNEYAKGKGAERAADAVGPIVGGGVGAYLGRGAGAIGAAEAAGAGALAGRYLGKPVVGGMVRSVIGRDGAPVSAGPPLPPIPSTPEQWQRTILAAKDGELSPGEAARRIARGGGSNAVKPLPPPP